MARSLRIVFKGKPIGEQFKTNMSKQSARVARSLLGAAQDAQTEILARGGADIAKAGNFGPRWTNGLIARITRGGGNIVIGIGHQIPFWTVFQKGKVILGKPLLWIPLSFASDAQRVSAGNYPGRLFRVDRKGGKAPLLLSYDSKEPKYFGKRSVTIPKKFHIFEISRQVAKKINRFYRVRFRRDKGGGKARL